VLPGLQGARPPGPAPPAPRGWGGPPLSERAALRPPTSQFPAATRTSPRPGLPGEPTAPGKWTAAIACAAPVIPSGPLHIVVSIAKQRATLFADGQPVAHSAVSTGTP